MRKIIRIEIRNDSVVLDGYVNAVQRDSKFIPSVKGKFKERIEPGAFRRSLEKREDVALLLNHNESRKLGSTKEGNLQLFEDNIGLRAICTITDAEVIEKAKNNQLRGWSFGFYKEKDYWEDAVEGFQRRIIEELDVFEVSIVDNTKLPAYVGTSIEMRNNEEVLKENRSLEFENSIVEDRTTSPKIDYTNYEEQIQKLKS